MILVVSRPSLGRNPAAFTPSYGGRKLETLG